MPANLPPQYYELEREFRACKDPQEKLRMAQELLRIMPKHKGTDKLQAEMKAKISLLRKEIEQAHLQPGGKHGGVAHDYIESEGSAQIIFIGAPNSGKSSLLASMTHAKPIVADYPYSTREPLTGMTTFETVHFQLIDTPPISDELFETYMPNLVRNADIVALVCDLTDPQIKPHTEFLLNALEEKKIRLMPNLDKPPDDLRFVGKRTLILAHKCDDELPEVRAWLDQRFAGFTIIPTTILEETTLGDLMRAVFQSLNVIRVYTKHIGKEVELIDPVILPIGATVEEAAGAIHKDFAANLKFAKVWGAGKFDGQRVQKDFVLSDRDIIEFHI
ncbi:MAG: 50S ribosome-binding GTPase [bacterium]|nr:50S ribosome-binding GTPase [bacterium]